jgi:hypothetical protein
MSADGVPIEEIARLAGHNCTATTELVHCYELRPVITMGTEVMERILSASRSHLPSDGHETSAMAITESDQVRDRRAASSPPADYGANQERCHEAWYA